MPDAPTLDDVRALLTRYAEMCEKVAADEEMVKRTRETFSRRAAMLRLALAALDDAERVEWLERAAACPLEIDNYGAGFGEPSDNDMVFLTDLQSGARLGQGETLRAAIDAARREGA